jgi:uncharacterized protein YbaP (TraB family)
MSRRCGSSAAIRLGFVHGPSLFPPKPFIDQPSSEVQGFIMIRKYFAGALALCSTALLGAAPAAKVDADPAMWVVRDADTTIYLFGTFHALDDKREWLNDEVKTAFDASSELVLEIVTPENQAEMLPAITRHAVDPSGRTLTSKLSPRGRKDFAAALARHKLPPTALDRYRPFFASMMLTMLDFADLGLGPDNGAEAVLRRAASGKTLGAVETVDGQLGMFAAMSEAEQVAMLEDGLKEDGAAIRGEVETMLAAWSKGDADAVAALIRKTDATSPALYKALFPDRNAKWAAWIDQRLDRPGTVFLAVGAGHLAGKDSVQQFLKRRGIASTRVRHTD